MWFRPSVAVHCTDVVPIGNVEPDGGEQETLSGAWPPLAEGVLKVTAMPDEVVVVADIGIGQDTASDAGVGVGVGVGVGEGDVGLLLLHAAETTSAIATT